MKRNSFFSKTLLSMFLLGGVLFSAQAGIVYDAATIRETIEQFFAPEARP